MCSTGASERYYADLSLKRRLSTPEGKKAYVRSLFATIADRYDLITVVLSYGLDWRWKLRLVDLVHPDANARSLDLATGTGDIAFLLRRGCAHVIGLDVTQRMVELARAKGSGRLPGRRHDDPPIRRRPVRRRDDRLWAQKCSRADRGPR
ncbi:MAG: hypothetical protein DMF90_27980 [Acidobacteria bacterium]|nr:MAG: hypothetical protein DMF90_27980 [Acidobacteriota bacterium]